MTSVYLTADDGAPCRGRGRASTSPLRVAGAGDPAPVRSYSLSSTPGADTYRISVKREPHGVVSALPAHPAAAGRGPRRRRARAASSCSTDGTGPVLLISAGIGVTPVLAMLHQLAAGEQHPGRVVDPRRPRTRPSTPSPARRTGCSQALPNAHEHIFYTAADAESPPALRRSAAGRRWPRSPASACRPTPTAYICGPAAFMTDMQRRARRARHRAGPGAHRAVRRAAGDQPRRHRRRPAGTAPAARAAGHRPADHLRPQRPDRALVRPRTARCSSWPTPATSRPGGPAVPASATPASRRSCPARSATRPTRSSRPAGRGPDLLRPARPATWCSTSERRRPSTVDGGQRRWTPTTRVSAAPRMRPSPAPATTSSGLCAPR